MTSRSIRGRVGARRCAVQALYQWQITETPPATIIAEFHSDRELNKVDLEYFDTLVRTIPREADSLRAHIEPLLDRQWQALGPVERSILLVGTYELVHCLEVPRKVVINEAVELARMFGADEGHKYINGVLDKLSHDVRAIEWQADSKASG
ncbi:MAG: transcription antitermination factor NusB [Gammaproteobacteria bacterium]|nr:transcription antitermination factor NusB [Gammaproteobacteria bacterium]